MDSTRREERPDGDDVLVVKIPDRLALTDGIEKVNVGAYESRRVRPLEHGVLHTLDGREKKARTRPVADVNGAAGDTAQHRQPVAKLLGALGDHDPGIGTKRIRIDRSDEDRMRRGVRPWNPSKRPGAERRPCAGAKKRLADRVGVERRERRRPVRAEGFFVVAIETDHDGLQRAALAAMNRDDFPAPGRGEHHTGVRFVFEQRLAENDATADFCEQARPQTSIVTRGQRHPSDCVGIVDPLLGLAGDGDVQPFSNPNVHWSTGSLTNRWPAGQASIPLS